MSAESNARSHVQEFHWWQGTPDLSDEEARFHDLLALHKATVELIRQQSDLLGYYDTDTELFDDDPDLE